MKTRKRFALLVQQLETRDTPSAGGWDPIGHFLQSGELISTINDLLLNSTTTTFGGPLNDRLSTGTVANLFSLQGTQTGYVALGLTDLEAKPITSFGSQGVLTIPVNLTPDHSYKSFLQSAEAAPNGQLISAGYFNEFDRFYQNTRSSLIVIRTDSTGFLDSTFGDFGKSLISLGQTDNYFNISDIAVQSDQSILLVGTARVTGQTLFARVLSNGELDTTFGVNGVYTSINSRFSPARNSIAVQAGTGRILISGSLQKPNGGDYDQAVLGLTSSGQVDSTFGQAGYAVAAFDLPTGNRNDYVSGFFLEPDGTFRLTGTANATSIHPDQSQGLTCDYTTASLTIASFLSDGSLNPNYVDHGRAVIPLHFEPVVGNPVLISYPLGVVEGSAKSFIFMTSEQYGVTSPNFLGYHIVRVQSFGQIDQSYGNSGYKGASVSTSDLPYESPAITFTPDASDLQISGPIRSVSVYSATQNSFDPVGSVNFLPHAVVSVRTVTADVNGDGVPDLIGGSGPGGGPHVIVIDGKSKFRMAEFFAFEQQYTGGINVAAGDLNGDGKAEIIVTPDRGGGPIVAVYDGAKLANGFNNDAQLTRFFGIEDKSFRGGARAAVGDVNGDGTADLLVSAGFEGGPRIALFNGTGIAPGTTPPPKLIPDFFAFEPSLRNGAYVTLGDLNGDGQAELVFGGGPGGAPRVRAFDGKGLLAAPPFSSLDQIPTAQLANFYAGDTDRRGGIRLAIKEIDGTPALLAASGENEAAQLRVFPAATLLGSANPQPSQVLDLFNGAVLADGVFVG